MDMTLTRVRDPGRLDYDRLVTVEKPSLNDVYHHGVKGMKWGVRNGPPYPVDSGGHVVRKKIKGVFTTVATDVKGKTAAGVERVEKSESTSGRSGTGVFTAEHYYDKYKAAGYSDKDAEQLARNAALTNKVILGLGIAVGTAALAYTGYRIYDTYADTTIKANGMLQTVHVGDLSTRTKGPFYATYLTPDNETYSSAMFGHLSNGSKISRLAATRDIKIASEASATKMFKAMLDDDTPVVTIERPSWDNKHHRTYYKKENVSFGDALAYIHPVQVAKYRAGELSRKDLASFYADFNYDLVKRDTMSTRFSNGFGAYRINYSSLGDSFYNALSKRGYSAVVDTHDSKRDMLSFRPLIVFGEPVRAIGSRPATAEDLYGEKKYAKAMAYRAIRSKLLKGASYEDVLTLTLGGSMATSIVGVRTYNLRSRKKFIDTYREEHPNSTMTDSEIKQLYDSKYLQFQI